MNFDWTERCQVAFEENKLILRSEAVLLAPDFDEQFKLYVDASDIGLGAVLLQEDRECQDHLSVSFQGNSIATNVATVLVKRNSLPSTL